MKAKLAWLVRGSDDEPWELCEIEPPQWRYVQIKPIVYFEVE